MLERMDFELSQDGNFLQNPNAKGNKSGDALFVVAAFNCEKDLVKLWLEGGGDEFGAGSIIPVSQENINKGFRSAVVAGHLRIVEMIVPHIDTIKEECSANYRASLPLAARSAKKGMVKAILRQRLNVYLQEKANESVPNLYALFKGQQDTSDKRQEVAAANALLAVLDDRMSHHAALMQHAMLRSGELSMISALIDQFYHGVPVPNEKTPLLVSEESAKSGCRLLCCTLL